MTDTIRQRLSRVPLYRNSENDDAELMTKAEIIHRREEALKMRFPIMSYDRGGLT